MKKRILVFAIVFVGLVGLAGCIDYAVRGIDSPAAYVVFFVVMLLRPGPLPLF